MNIEIVTFAGSSLALREPIVWEREVAKIEEVRGEPGYAQSAALTTAGLLWLFAIVSCSQEAQPVTIPSIDQLIAQVADGKDITKKQIRVHNVIRLLDQWIADTSGYDEETWPRLKKAMDEDRLSSRRLFDE